MADASPCQRCGACCASFRVSFYWGEPESAALPPGLTEQLTPFLACMKGTNQAEPRCIALRGEVGGHVSCSQYEQRPSTCREPQPGDAKCQQARAIHGLPPLEG